MMLKFYTTKVELNEKTITLHHGRIRQAAGCTARVTIPLAYITRVNVNEPGLFTNGHVEIHTSTYKPDAMEMKREHYIVVTAQQKKAMRQLLAHIQ